MSKLFSKLNESMDEPAQQHPFRWYHAILLLILCAGTIYIIRDRYGVKDSTADTGNAWEQNLLQKAEGGVFGTFYHITYQSTKKLDEGIKESLDMVNHSLSMFEKESTISLINSNQSMETDSMFAYVFNLAKNISAETNGAFDITVAPLVNLWGFGFKNCDNVTDKAVDSLLQYVGINDVSLIDGKIVKVHPETMLDCSAIAKGYGVDAVGKYLESQGVQHYMVEIGGEVRVRGFNPRGENWSIGITRPEDDSTCVQNDIEEVLQVTDLSMATSGNYRNFYMKGGKKYAHTIDPRTGRPVQHNILSSTVLASDCATADAYATSFMVLGLEEAKKVLDKHDELMAFFVYYDDKGEAKQWYSPKLKDLLRNKKSTNSQ